MRPCSLCAASHGWTTVQSLLLHTKLHGSRPMPVFCGNAALNVCAPHCECSMCRKKLASVLAMQPLCRSHDLPQSNHDFCTKAAWPRPSQFCGTCAPQCGAQIVSAALCRQKLASVLAMQPLCRSHGWTTVVNHYLHTKLGLMFFAAMLHSQFVPHIVATVPQTGSVLAMQPLCRSHGWTVVNHYLPQSKHGVCTMVFCGNDCSQFWGIVTTMWGTN